MNAWDSYYIVAQDRNKFLESYECQCIAKIGLSCKFFWKYILCPSRPTSVQMLLQELKITTLRVLDRVKRKEIIWTRGKLTSYFNLLKEVCNVCFLGFVCNLTTKDILFVGLILVSSKYHLATMVFTSSEITSFLIFLSPLA